ncbi:hypothetical protein DFH27DRAFT_617106 [Peziza echinospora]|nr:hypothetical protein DFH27DRAFT_617106 [Peziza echinospora]
MDHTDAREQSDIVPIAAASEFQSTSGPSDGISASPESPLETIDVGNGGNNNNNDDNDSDFPDHSSRSYCPSCGYCTRERCSSIPNIAIAGTESSQQATATASADINDHNQQPLQVVDTSDTAWDATSKVNEWAMESADGWREEMQKPVSTWEGCRSVDMIALESRIDELVDEKIRVLFGGDLGLIETLIEKYGRRPEPTWETGSKTDIMVGGPTSQDAGQAAVGC